jgi:2-dehydro-3-deoxyphosphogluconate aldolase/(4S)-4-hydroxy-2-oxoglutarate aldolase
MDLDRFRELPLMGIVRGVKADAIEPLVETCVSSGLETIEITFNTPGAPDLIRRASKAARGRLMVGAGTITSTDDMKIALDAGARFIVSPVLVYDVVEYCAECEIPVFPGALTPQEIYNAWHAGATMVKVFPAKFFGPEYIKEVKGPFDNIELLACGGVTPANIKSFFSCGASAVAFGASVFKPESLAARNFDSIGNNLRELVAAFKSK